MATTSRSRRRTCDNYVKVNYLNGDLTGWADPIEVVEGTTVEDFLDDQMDCDVDFEECHIRVNREATTPEYVLKEGDTVSVTPKKIEGA